MLSTLYFAYINCALCIKSLLIQGYCEDDWFDDDDDLSEYIANYPNLPPIFPLNIRRILEVLR